MRRNVLAIAITAAFLPGLAMAEAGDWVVRARIVDVSPNENSDLGKTVNRNVAPVMSPGAELAVDSNVIPEVDVSYYFTKHIAAELILATGTRHDVSVRGDANAVVGNQDLGSVDALPPTLLLQWHFNPDQTFDPYVGAGINYTRMLDRNLQLESGALAGTKIKVESDSWGFAVQAGLDVNLKDGWLINADVKYINIETDVKLKVAGWTKIDELDINPWVFGIGVGKKF
jgi:outer membrane protein